MYENTHELKRIEKQLEEIWEQEKLNRNAIADLASEQHEVFARIEAALTRIEELAKFISSVTNKAVGLKVVQGSETTHEQPPPPEAPRVNP